ncbi:MAG TPA: adenylate/guanylate cyclase domain-containing protein [Spirochaetota bacterium]
MTTNVSTNGKSGRVRFTIGFKLVSIISILIVVSFGAMISIANFFFRDSIEKNIQSYNLDIVMKTSMKVESDFSSILDKGNVVAAALLGEIGSGRDRDAFKDLFFSRDHDLVFIGVGVRNPKTGGISLKTKVVNDQFFQESSVGIDAIDKAIVSDEEYFARSFNGQSEVHNVSPFFGQPMIGISAPYSRTDPSRADAILIIYVKMDRFLAVVRSADSMYKVFIANIDGDIIAHDDTALVNAKTSYLDLPIVKMMLKSANQNAQTTFNYKGRKYLGSFNKINFGGVGMVSMVDHAYAFADAEKMIRRNLLIALIVLSIAILVIYYFSKTLTNPVRRLVGATKEIEEGNFVVDIVPSSRDEIGLLTESFVNMGKGLAEREKMKDAFGKFVNKDIAERILRDEIKLGGERKTAAIFFSDIRSFTAISENLQPEEVVEFLNQYMTRMVGCVNQTHGVVDKFIGDAIMGVWGTPISHGNDTANAVECALRMRDSLIDFNKDRGGPKKPLIRIGCGINTGPVLAGQIGSQDRMEYTVIGDAVNLASRIESLNKPFGTDILVSEDAYQLVKDLFVVAPMEKIMVKGKKDPQQIYAVLARKNDPQGIKTLSELRSLLGVDEKKLEKFDPMKEEKKYEFVK